MVGVPIERYFFHEYSFTEKTICEINGLSRFLALQLISTQQSRLQTTNWLLTHRLNKQTLYFSYFAQFYPDRLLQYVIRLVQVQYDTSGGSNMRAVYRYNIIYMNYTTRLAKASFGFCEPLCMRESIKKYLSNCNIMHNSYSLYYSLDSAKKQTFTYVTRLFYQGFTWISQTYNLHTVHVHIKVYQ